MRELGSVYLGGVDPCTLRNTRLVEGGDAALRRLDAVLRHDVQAECLDMV